MAVQRDIGVNNNWNCGAVQETIFHSSGSPYEVFRSSHIEPRVSLTAVLRKCCVRSAQPGTNMDAARQSVGALDESYVCMYMYDIANMSLRALTIAESDAIC